MKIWLGLLSALLAFSASASNYKSLDESSNRVNEQTSSRVSWGDADRLKNSTRNNSYIYESGTGPVLLTNITIPSRNFDKFTKKVTETYFEDIAYKDIKREREWERQLSKKPAARIGMSQKQVLNNTNWGQPKNISTTIDASGTSERWIYSSTHSLYFKNNKLTRIEK